MAEVLDAMVRAYEIQGALGLLNDFRKHGMGARKRVSRAGACAHAF